MSLATIAQRVQRLGFWGRGGCPLECAAAQVCREAGARVTTNVLVRDMDLAHFNALDSRRFEVVADGLTLWRCAQWAVDTILVSPLSRNGAARRRAANHDGAALGAVRKRKEDTHPETCENGRTRFVVLAAEVGGRWSVRLPNSCVLSPRLERRAGWRQFGCVVGVLFWLAAQQGRLPSPCWTGIPRWGQATLCFQCTRSESGALFLL